MVSKTNSRTVRKSSSVAATKSSTVASAKVDAVPVEQEPVEPPVSLSVDDIVGSGPDAPVAPANVVVSPVQPAPVVSPVGIPIAAPAPVSPAPFVPRPAAPFYPSQPAGGYQNQYQRPAYRQYNNNGYQSYERTIPDANLPTEYVEGVLDVTDEGYGYLRPKFSPSDKDVYISASQIRRFSLRPGDVIGGQARAPKDNERYYGLLKVEKVDGGDVAKVGIRPKFENLVPVYPDVQIILETGKTPISARIIDLVSPIGRGQRGLLVSPPKAGKTWLMKDVANGVTKNFPEAHLMAVLVGERPEEVTDISRSIKGEVVASNFDEPPEHQTRTAEMAIERAKRLVERGKHVVMLLDSITRLARAYNLSIPTSGRTLSGGFDPAALWPPKRFFGAARNIEKGGSLTIIGTCLVDTGSKMDDLIYEEFKGTGNMELHLDRRLAERRVYPSIDIQRSGTRQEQLLFGEKLMPKIVTMRKMLDMLGSDERTDLFIQRLSQTKSNEEFLKTLGQG